MEHYENFDISSEDITKYVDRFSADRIVAEFAEYLKKIEGFDAPRK